MKFVLFAVLLLLCPMLIAQDFRGLDKSPMDRAYYPDNFAHDRENGDVAIIKVTYSRPEKQRRTVFGELVPFGQVWRTGANESTEVMVYSDIEIGGKTLPEGTYSLFSIPGEKEWTIIFNKDLDYWGSYSYDEGKDVLRVTADVRQASTIIEAFAIQFQYVEKNKARMLLAWDQTIIALDFTH